MTKLVTMTVSIFSHWVTPPVYNLCPIAIIATTTSSLVWMPFSPQMGFLFHAGSPQKPHVTAFVILLRF